MDKYKMLSLALVSLVTAIIGESSFAACTHYAAPGGTGNGSSVSSPFRVSDFLNISQPGMTLCLASGTYTASNGGLLRPPEGRNGTASQPIKVMALDESNPPLFDGQFADAPAPVLLYKNNYWTIEGINVRHGSSSTLAIYYGTNVIVRRVVAWDSWIAGNNGVCGVHYTPGPVLFEDVACFGTGRKIISPTQNTWTPAGGTGFTCRRCWSRFDGSLSTGPSGASMVYNAWNMTYENLLANFSATQMPDSYTVLDSWPPQSIYSSPVKCGPGGTGQCPIAGQTYGFGKWASGAERLDSNYDANSRLLGSLAYVKANDPLWYNNAWGHAGQGQGGLNSFTIKDVFGYISPQNPRFNAADGASHAVEYGDPGNGGFNLIADRVTQIGGVSAHSAWKVTNTYSGNSMADVNAAGRNPFTTTIGANLCYRYINGVRTNEPLWPWPMNDRIKQATAMAGRYSGPCPGCSGGFRVARTATDVTAEVQALLGTIPSQCLSGAAPSPAPVPEPTPSTDSTFTIGQRVQVSLLGPAHVRETAGEGVLLGTQPIGAVGTVTGGPASAIGYTWWKVDYDSGVDGWSTEGLLAFAAVPGPTIDSLAPSVTITSPANGSILSRWLK
jgi:hypothetical protein